MNNSDRSLEALILEMLLDSEGDIVVASDLHAVFRQRSHRTIQRALRSLLDRKLIYRVGKGPGTKYKIVNQIKTVAALDSKVERNYLNLIKISADGHKVLSYVAQEEGYRKPIGYNRVLLDAYVPNNTYYLDETTRKLLYQIGTTPYTLKPAGTYGIEILHQLLIDLSWASSKLEGNTYSRLDTQNLIDFQQYADGKDLIEAQMILNHKQAIIFLINNIQHVDFDKYTILNLHGLLSNSLLVDPNDSGKLRHKIVNIGKSVYKPMHVPQVISECFELILDKAKLITDPFEQLFFIMVHLPYLQAFVDVNKRVSRLAANIPLLKNNLCPLTFIGLPEQAYIDANLGVYELQDYSLLRDVFVWAYERSAQEYLVAQKNLVAPDLVRFKYREAIHALVRKIVIDGKKEYANTIKEYAQKHVLQEDRRKFEHMVLEDIRNLHEGVLARYDLNLDQLIKWQQLNS